MRKPIAEFRPFYEKMVKEGGTLLLSSNEIASLDYEYDHVCYIQYPDLNETSIAEYELYYDSDNRAWVKFYERFGFDEYFNARLVKITDY